MAIEIFKDLHVVGQPEALDNLPHALTQMLRAPWERDAGAEAEAVRLRLGPAVLAFRRAADGSLPAAGLTLLREEDCWSVPNIVPLDGGSLGHRTYNALLDEFVADFIRPAAEPLGLRVLTTEGETNAVRLLGGEIADLLDRFSGAANQATGTAHPRDFERWAAFVVAAHRASLDIGADLLERILVDEQGWPGDRASDLVIQYEQGRGLLRFYDEVRDDG
ncbi:hypothetical protein [Falsiroseomonas ponticola]|uniref:hypothetical protein n=1 Tax=Falsiroseomonas ponticola TaxID=2786951 RepID=UPI00193168C5|nr:hypothetical protein [Roseomonas ponticola]